MLWKQQTNGEKFAHPKSRAHLRPYLSMDDVTDVQKTTRRSPNTLTESVDNGGKGRLITFPANHG